MEDLLKRITSLSPTQQKLLEKRLQDEGLTLAGDFQDLKDTSYISIQPAPQADHYPLAPAQKRLFLLNQIEGSNINYNLPAVSLIESELDHTRLEEVFQTLISRHDILRTSFQIIEGEVKQRIHPEVNFKINHFQGDQTGVAEIITQFIRPFDLREAPLLRVGLIRLDEAKYVLMMDMSHLISDGVSGFILMKEFVEIYEGRKLPPLRIQYQDYAVWQNELIQKEKFKKQEDYWLSCFSGEIPVLNLVTDYPRPAMQSFEGGKVEFSMGPEMAGALNKLAQETGSTLYMILLAAYTIVLSKYSGQEDIIVGSPSAGRQHADLKNIVGMFVNTLAMRNYPVGEKTFLEFLGEVKENALKAYENQDYQFEELVEKLNLRRDLSRNPLFDTMFALQNLRYGKVKRGGLKISPYPFEPKVAKFDLTLQASGNEQRLYLLLDYCVKLFKRETVERLMNHLIQVIKEALKNPKLKLSEIELLSENERHQIIYEFNDTQTEWPKDKTLPELLEEQVFRTPDHVALVYEEQQLNYKELNKKANQLARMLRAKGVKQDSIVGIMAERSLEMLIGIIGILKAGGAYLPIDPEYPEERVKFMLEDSGVQILLTQSHLNTGKSSFNQDTIILDSEGIYLGATANLETINGPHDLAYIIYTSGSTGKPKGVMIEHQAVHNLIQAITQRIDFSAYNTILALTTISFDIFGLETTLPLTRGLKVVIASEKEQRDSRLLGETINKNKIQMLQITPSHLQLLLDAGNHPSCFESLTEIMIGGEALSEHLLSRIQKLTHAKIYNMYGPTETTIWSTIKDVTEDTRINIGAPIANTQIYIVNDSFQPQPIGVAGELCIAGEGLARGYLNRPDLTGEKFVEPLQVTSCKLQVKNQSRTEQLQVTNGKLQVINQSQEVELQDSAIKTCFQQPSTCNFQHTTDFRFYRTGDLARWLPEGNIEFLGRLDHQVKIRGFRIELGEIESQLLQNEVIREAVVITKQDSDGNNYLCAYLVGDQELTVQDLRVFLANKLPDYMIPTRFIQLQQMPLTPNGKIDRMALPAPDGGIQTGVEFQGPRNEMEAMLVKIWADVLEIEKEKISIHDNFFNIGGNSLSIVKVEIALETNNFRINYVELYQFSTIVQLASHLENQSHSNPMV